MKFLAPALALVFSAGTAHPQAAADPFYRKPTIHVTWIMIWNGSTEKHWWKPSDYQGCRVEVDGVWQSINWNDRNHIRTYVDAIHAAGIDVIVADLTNGFGWEWQARLVQELCRARGMKFAVAFNPQAGEAMETGCSKVWAAYAAPEAGHSDAYLHLDGRPLVVLYTWRKGYQDSLAQDGEFRRKFTTVWASGEDSDRDKWGWQLEPAVGPVPSSGTMFVTGSVKFDSPQTADQRWRRHLAWLDYGFLLARRAHPRFLVVGSFDDVHERNAWMVADTAAARPGWQMRDPAGALSTDAWYRRVRAWIRDGKPRTVEGGPVRDGAYRVAGADRRLMGCPDARDPGVPAVPVAAADQLDRYLWFYHLGGGEYRIIKLDAGLALEAAAAGPRFNWDSDAPAQRWRIRAHGDAFSFVNRATGGALALVGDTVALRPPDAGVPAQRWTLAATATIPR